MEIVFLNYQLVQTLIQTQHVFDSLLQLKTTIGCFITFVQQVVLTLKRLVKSSSLALSSLLW